MNTKNRIHLSIYFFILILSPLNAIIDIKPETFKPNDIIFSTHNEVQYLYAAGYFTSNNIDPYLRNQGYSLSHDTSVIFSI